MEIFDSGATEFGGGMVGNTDAQDTTQWNCLAVLLTFWRFKLFTLSIHLFLLLLLFREL